ncbi:alpha/beta fold hydrolase [Streptomyces griseobrunneus]|uniref:alpha/beta fold hydrolase n=1 Tax=Streptomyces microflavus TaxID=1919 RepID=UPI00380A845B
MDIDAASIPDPLKLGKGPGLLLAHGAGSDIQDSYGPVIERLTAVSTVVGPDFPGSGNCPLPQGRLTLDGTADYLVASAVRAGVESFAISGFSMGTAVAVRAATRHPDRVTGLILSSGFAYPNSRLRLVIDTWRALARDTRNPRTLASYLSLLVGGPQWLDGRSPEEVEEQVALFSAGMPVGADAQLAMFDHIDVREDLRTITVPTLVISPLADLITTPLHSRELADGIPHAELVTLDCGHAIAAERPEAWADAMTKFLTALPLAGEPASNQP